MLRLLTRYREGGGAHGRFGMEGAELIPMIQASPAGQRLCNSYAL